MSRVLVNGPCHRWHENETAVERTNDGYRIAPDSLEAKECDRYMELQKGTIGAEGSLLFSGPMSNPFSADAEDISGPK